ncbi:MAG: hypothetical protein U5J83_06370 [Bryobacterales bacterium]|nr:hypothetical protein [Bryobacterales bacterium]
MAGGANKKFIDQKLRFLRDNIIEVTVVVTSLAPIAAANVDANKNTLAQRGRIANKDVAVNLQGNVAAGIYDFDLFKTPKRAQIPGGGRANVYQLKEWGTKQRDQEITTTANSFTVAYKKPKYAHPIQAYWVPWSSGSCWSVQLGNDADFFFTPTMDGCSLAISSGASPIVTHGNYKKLTDPTKASQGQTLNELTQHHTTTLGSDVNKTLLKNQYVASVVDKTAGFNNLVTVVGFRDTVGGTWSFYWQRRRVNAANPDVGIVLQDRAVLI